MNYSKCQNPTQTSNPLPVLTENKKHSKNFALLVCITWQIMAVVLNNMMKLFPEPTVMLWAASLLVTYAAFYVRVWLGTTVLSLGIVFLILNANINTALIYLLCSLLGMWGLISPPTFRV